MQKLSIDQGLSNTPINSQPDLSSGIFRGVQLWIGVLLIVIAIGAWSAWNAYIDFNQTIDQEYRLLEVRARQCEARIFGSLRSVNLMLGSIIDDLHQHPKMSVADKNLLLDSYLRQLPELRSLFIVDATGHITDFNSNYLKYIGLDVSKREYFTAHLDSANKDGFRITAPFKTASGKTATNMSRALRDKDGHFAGVISATLESSFFDDTLKFSVYEPGLQSVLIHLQGDILNWVPASILIGKNLKGGIAYTEHINSGQPTTRHLNRDKLEQIKRMSVFHNVPGSPLAVIVFRDYNNVVDEWYSSMFSHFAGFLLLSASTLIFAWSATRRQRALVTAQIQIAEREAELRTIIETEPECVKQLADDGSILNMNRAGLNMIEADSLEQVLGQKVQELLLPEYRNAFIELIQKVFTGESDTLEFEIQGLKGGHRWLDTHAVPLVNSLGRITTLLGVTRDISDRKYFEKMQEEAKQKLESQLTEITELQLRLQEQAIRDPLTGLFNRRFLDETLPRELSLAKREGYALSLVMLDLDHFKQVNDTFGHSAGDEVLKYLSSILSNKARESDIICRYGGEEFLVVLPRMSPEHALQRVEAWRIMFSESPVRHGDLMINSTFSAGISGFPVNGSDVDILISRADESMYRSKKDGRNRITCYTFLAIRG